MGPTLDLAISTLRFITSICFIKAIWYTTSLPRIKTMFLKYFTVLIIILHANWNCQFYNHPIWPPNAELGDLGNRKWSQILVADSPSGRDTFCLKNFDTFARTSVRVSKMNAVAHAQLTFQISTLFIKKYWSPSIQNHGTASVWPW